MTNPISSRGRLSHPPQKFPDLISAQQHSDEVKNRTTNKYAQSKVQPVLGKFRVVHATPGRVRIRATDGSNKLIFNTISQYLESYQEIEEVSVNQQTGSITIAFDENQLSLAEILRRLEELGIPQQGLSSAHNSDPFAAWKSIDFWKEQGISFVPLFTGLGITSALRITGLASIPVYMITADATRRVIDYIQPQLSAQKNKQQNQVSSEATLEKVEQQTAIRPEMITNNTVNQAHSVAEQPEKIAYSIVHQVPGRIRIHVPRIGRDHAYARRLEKVLKTDPQVTNVRLNYDAVSVAIAYQPSHISASHWIGLIQSADQTAQTAVQVVPSQTIEQTTEPQQEQQETQQLDAAVEELATELLQTGLWSNFKSPALSYSLSFMANFPLAGPD